MRVSDPSDAAAALRGISKSFGSLEALDNVDVDFRRGSIHALLGENGAGKTTLARIIAGMLVADRGTVYLDGVVAALRDRKDGLAAGVGLVQQHMTQIGELTVTENFLLGAGDRVGNRRSAAEAVERTAESLGFSIDPGQLVRDLSLSDCQRLEVMMAVSTECKVLILDEPTSLMGTADTGELFEALHRLRERGTALIYVSHKLREVIALADEATVLRRGKVVDRLKGTEITERRLARAMVGEHPQVPEKRPGASTATSVVVLRGVGTTQITTDRNLTNVDFSVRRGEVVGIAGLAGSGQVALCEVLVGLREASEGRIYRHHETVAYIPEDRHRDAVAESLSVVDNLVVRSHRSLLRYWLLPSSAKMKMASSAIDGFRVPSSALSEPVATLSGGNQQRVVLARELFSSPELVVANNPYAGLDISSIADVRQRLHSATEGGAGVVIFSPELEDLFDLASRIDVMFDGTIAGSFQPDDVSADEIGQLIGGGNG